MGFPILSRAHGVASLAFWRGSVVLLLVSSQTCSQTNHPSLVQFCQKKPRDFCVWFEYQERKKLMPSEKFLFLDKIGLKSGVWNGYQKVYEYQSKNERALLFCCLYKSRSCKFLISQNASELVTVPSQGKKIKSSTMLQCVGLGHG